MFSRLLNAFGVRQADDEQDIIRIGAALMAAGHNETVIGAIEENDRLSHLDIIGKLLRGAPGIDRNPADALCWANAALERGRKIQIAEYAEKTIPDAIATDKFIVKKGHGKLLERANRGDGVARREIGALLLAEAKKTRGEVFWRLDGGNFTVEGPGALFYQRALDWYAMAKEAGDEAADKAGVAICVDLINRCKPASDAPEREEAAPAPASEPVKRPQPRREPRRAAEPGSVPARAPGTPPPDFVARRANGSFTAHIQFPGGSVRVLGGRLPKLGQINSEVEIRFDGQHPRYTGKSGTRLRYSTDGHLQVFYKTPEAANKYVWIARFVDTYNLF